MDRRKKVIEAAEKALVELEKVIKQKIDFVFSITAVTYDDNKFAFISLEGVGGEPGVVDVISLEKFNLITSVKVGKQAGGIAFWKISD